MISLAHELFMSELDPRNLKGAVSNFIFLTACKLINYSRDAIMDHISLFMH